MKSRSENCLRCCCKYFSEKMSPRASSNSYEVSITRIQAIFCIYLRIEVSIQKLQKMQNPRELWYYDNNCLLIIKQELQNSKNWVIKPFTYIICLIEDNIGQIFKCIIMTELVDDGTRTIKSVTLPFQKSFEFNQIAIKGSYDSKKIINFLEREGRLQKDIVMDIIRKTIHILKMEPNLLNISGVVSIVGDIHGQFYDFIWLLNNKLKPENQKVLFLGDYVDRGYFSMQVLLTLLVLKINNPKNIMLLRGNHECQQMTTYFNFKQQCLKKYDQQIYHELIQLFNCLPLAAVVNNTFFCVHGGISQSLSSIQKIIRLNRFQQIPKNGLFCDLLWADPTSQTGGALSGYKQIQNTQRGCSFIFGNQLASQFLQNNKLQCIIRGHQAEEDGYRLFNWQGKNKFPSIITVFSAPNYCDFYNNQGACMRIENNEMQIEQFKEVQHPYLLPDFMDAFEWSMPFIIERVSQMMFHLLEPDRKIEIDNDFQLIMKMEIMKKIFNGHKALAQHNYQYTNFKGRALDNLLAHDQQAKQYFKEQHKSDHKDFLLKKSIDLKHQKRPLNQDNEDKFLATF